MAITIQKAHELSGNLSKQLAGNELEWRQFLKAAGNLYKYPFSEQLMIYAQRPDATATASYDTWNKLGRYVTRGSKGIALFKEDGSGLKYVFDVSNTEVHEKQTSKVLPPWKMKKRHTESVFRLLESEYGTEGTGQNYPDRLGGIVDAAVLDSFSDLYERMEQEIQGTRLAGLEEDQFKAVVTQALSSSVSYMVFARMGVNPELYLDSEDFSDLWHFDTPELMGILGEAVGDMAAPILRTVEREVKRMNREKTQNTLEKTEKQEYNNFSALKHETEKGMEHDQQSGIHPQGGLSVSESDHGGAGRGHWEIRQDAAAVPERAPEGQTQRPVAGGDVKSTPVGDKRDDKTTDRPDGRRNAERQPSPGQGNRSAGLGAAHEHADGISGGGRDEGDYIQLNFFNTLPDLPSQSSQIEQLEKAESKPLPAFFSSPETAQPKPTAPGNFVHTLNALGQLKQEHGVPIPKDIPAEGQAILEQEGLARLQKSGEHVPDPLEPVNRIWEHPSPEQSSKRIAPPTAGNFRITDINLGEGGQKTKYGYNMAAIKTLKQIESEGRHATPEEQAVLHRYVGWGGIPQAFDAENPKWEKEYAELKALLTGEEYAAARRSTLNAHYTSPVVIKAMYDGLERLGFEKGNLLEPAMGVGNFFGLLPKSMQDSRLYGVEMDSITGRIAGELYPDAKIQVKGFQDVDYPDAFFDVAIGNIPFGSFGVADKRYDRHKFLIHDYFIARTLDKVRPGGVVAFITSNGTLDKQDPSVRKYLSQRAELLGAVRLPNNAFQKNAGTEVTTDILFLKKRDRILDLEADWVHLSQTEDGVPVNHYFTEHPEMMLGKMVFDESMYGDKNDMACHPIPGADLSEQLQQAIAHIHGEIDEYTLDDAADLEHQASAIPADPDVRNHSYTMVEGRLYFRENSLMVPVQKNMTAMQRIQGMIEIRDCTRRVLDYQLNGYSDQDIQDAQAALNRAYDAYTANYGLLNSTGNKQAFSEDVSYPLLCSLENLDSDGKLKSKADLFTKRTIKAYQPVTHVETAAEALAVSLSEKAGIDMGFMSSLMGGDKLDVILSELQGIIFKDPLSDPDDLWTGWQTADEYLSGNVRQKLSQAETAVKLHPQYESNVQSLRQVQPKELTATEIEVKLGTTWIPQEDYTGFLRELLGVPASYKDDFSVRYLPLLNEYRVEGIRGLSAIDTALNNTYGTKRVDALTILLRTLNQKNIQVYDLKTDENGNEVRVPNAKETAIAQNRQDKIKRVFRDWIWKDQERRDRLCKTYNVQYNSTRPREFDGSHLTFPGMNPEIKLEPHQKDAVARILYGDNTLLAHVVGAGKTYVMIAAAMEAKRLGLAEKPMFVVPNHLTEQFGSDVLKLYPGANVLISTKKDFEPSNRKKFCSRISTGNYDAVIIGHSQFEKIPLSKERQILSIQAEVDDLTRGIETLKAEKGERYTVKQLERARQKLEEKMKRLNDASRKDDVVTFEQLGVDRLNVDEAHAFKNLFMYTKMQNVAGVSSSAAQRSSDMYWKTGYMDELTGGKGVVFATGTPISNSMTELYTMERYLMRDRLKELDLAHFDQWASTFGEVQAAMELAPEGTGFRLKNRFSRFFNLPEVVNLFKEVADIKTADMLNLPRPDAHFHDVTIDPSDYQQDFIESLADRAEMVRKRDVTPREDNMLKITSDGRKAALDQRLINPLLPDAPDSKVNACVNNIFNIYTRTTIQKSAQLVFCDLSTPTNGSQIPMIEKEDGTWAVDREQYRFQNVYDDLKVKLMDKGIPANEIAFIHDAKNDKQKAEIFAKVRSGDIRVLIGSTAKMGAGTNVQKKLKALHHLDVPWKPSDIEQQEGRILRQGNDNPEVDIFRYITKSTFDAYSWQIIENKQKFIGQIMTSKNPARSCEDVDETALSYAEVKALATGDPRIKEKMDLDIQIANLRTLKADYLSQHYTFEDDLAKRIPQKMQNAKVAISKLKTAKEALDGHPMGGDRFSMEIGGKLYTERKEAGSAIIALCLSDDRPDGVIGSYRGFEMSLHFDEFAKQFKMELKNGVTLSADISEDGVGTVNRMNNAVEKVPQLLQQNRDTVQGLKQQIVTIQEELKKPFPHTKELEQKEERMNTLLHELAEAEKEQSAKRALKKSENLSAATESPKSIRGFLENFTPPPTKPSTKQEHDLGREL